MRKSRAAAAIIAILAVQWFLLASATSQFTGDFMTTNETSTETECKGSMGECSYGEVELEMDSEINRRMLAARRYISYGALRRNSVPCSRRGASYYNCRRGAQANPYSRGCSTITRCRR